jgi:hypothetical protein
MAVATHHAMTGPLSPWRDGAAQQTILDFVIATTMPTSPDHVRIDDRIAVFDLDGTLWCEKPVSIHTQFLMRRLAAMANRDPGLRTRQPWKAALDRDVAWIAEAFARRDRELTAGLAGAYRGATVEEVAAAAMMFLRNERHPQLGRHYSECTYRPMVALARFLEANRFTIYLAAGGGRDFVRTISQDLYGIAPERVIGSSRDLDFMDGEVAAIVHERAPDLVDDGPATPIQTWSRVGRRPIFVAGNSNGDIPMLRYAAHPSRRSLSVLIDHDDAERDFAYRSGAEEALRLARVHGWLVVSVKRDWADVMSSSGS